MRMGICVPFTKLQRSQVFVEAPSFSVLLIRAEHKVIIICVNKASASIKHQLISGQLLQGQHLSPAGVMIGEDYLLELHSKTSLAYTVRTASLTSSQFSSTWGETLRYDPERPTALVGTMVIRVLALLSAAWYHRNSCSTLLVLHNASDTNGPFLPNHNQRLQSDKNT